MSTIYSPPKHVIKREHYIIFFKTLGNRSIAADDYNAKHMYWRLRLILLKGRELFNAIEDMNLAILSTGESIYWPSNNKKIFDLLNFGIIRSIPKNFCRIKSCFELPSNYSSVIFIINSKIMTKGKSYTLCNAKIKWFYL
jgi:hypothetical protein